MSIIFALASTCLNHTEQIFVQYKKRGPPPLPKKPLSLSKSSFPPPPLPPKKHLKLKSSEGQKPKAGNNYS